jgi:uncharacterized protein (TIGR02118 family)
MKPRVLPGIVRMGLIRRLPSLTPAEFSTHWRGPHGQLGKTLPNLRRYHQNHVMRRFAVAGVPDRWDLDGLSELWFDSLDVMRRSIASSAYQTLATDTPTVMTMPGLIAGVQEQVAGEGAKAAHKLMMILGRRRELEPQAFLVGWRALAASVCAASGASAATNTVVSHREESPGREVPYETLPIDLVAEFWFEHDAAIDDVLDQQSFHSSVAALVKSVSAYAVQPLVIVG